jgi:DNA-binding Lrp family transcriptional regulator
MRVAKPAQSVRAACGVLDSLTRHLVMATAATPIGRFTKKMPRQLIPVVITPPSTGPSPTATPVTAPEIFSTIRSRDHDQRTPLLLGQLSLGRQVVALEAYCLLHLFAAGVSPPPGSNDLSQKEIDQLLSPARARTSMERSTLTLQGSDWPLVQALAEDGRAPYRHLAVRTHCHESTVRRRVEELIASGALSFDVDLDTDAFGIRAPALLWMSVVPAKLTQIGQALAGRPEVPFVAATTGSTNLVAALLCQDDRSLYEFLTEEVSTLDGLTHIETAPVMRAVKMHATMTPPQS